MFQDLRLYEKNMLKMAKYNINSIENFLFQMMNTITGTY